MAIKTRYIYGFEEYKVVSLSSSVLFADWNVTMPYNISDIPDVVLASNNLPVSIPTYSWLSGIIFSPSLYEDHRELLSSARKVYVHPSCNLSRSLIAEKYSKCLSPWTADAVVVPTPNGKDCILTDSALFINDNARLIVMVYLDYQDDAEKCKSFQEGSTLVSLCRNMPLSMNSPYYSFDDAMNAKLFYIGKYLSIPNSQSYILDAITHNLPLSKTVFEETMQNSLGTEENKITFENLISIHEMLKSADENTQAAGMKALSMMDYMHYANSIKLMFSQMNTWEWRYNKANSSTSVKFMLKSIFGERWRRWRGDYNKNIYPQDLELFKRLLLHYEKLNDEDVANRMASLEFMKVNAEGMLVPVLAA